MNELIALLLGIIERGLVLAPISLALYLTSYIIKFDDLTIEGSFGTGGALTACLLVYGCPWPLAIFASVIGGALCGLVTGLLYTQLKINNLISGIIVATALFSINIKLATSYKALSHIQTIFSTVPTWCNMYKGIIILAPLLIGVVLVLHWFLTTKAGYLLQALGNNPQFLTNLGKSTAMYTCAMLMLANGMSALAGSLFVQYVSYFSIWTNVGMLILGLAGLIIAQTFTKKMNLAILLGPLFYQAIIAVTFELQLDQDLNKLITALLIVLLISLNHVFEKK